MHAEPYVERQAVAGLDLARSSSTAPCADPHRGGERRRSRGSSARSSLRAAAPIASSRAGVASCGGVAEDAASCAAASSASSMPGGASVSADLHELREQLVEVAAAGRVRGDLAERRDRDGVAHARPLRDGRRPRRSASQPRSPSAPSKAQR